MDLVQVHRKLQPVYSALDAGDFKTAIKYCERKDLANVDLAQALKAFALERKVVTDKAQTGGNVTMADIFKAKQERLEEALTVARQIARKNPPQTNEALIRTLLLTFRNLGKWNDIIEMLSNAFQHSTDPSDRDDFGKKLFSWYLRNYDFASMERHGMALGKVLKSDDYIAWSAASAIMNAQHMASSPDQIDTAKQKLRFAEMLLRKALSSLPESSATGSADQSQNEDDASQAESKRALRENVKMLLVRALLMQEKFEEAASFAQEEFSHLQARERLLIIAEVHQIVATKLNKPELYQAAADAFYKLLLEEDPEDWRNWVGYLETITQLRPLPEHSESILSEIQIIKTKAQENNEGKATRGPLLAESMLYTRAYISAIGNSGGRGADDILENLVSSISNYLTHFDGKACCFGDLRNILLPFVSDSSDGELVKNTNRPLQPPGIQFVYTQGTDLGQLPFRAQIEAKFSRRWPVEDFAALVPAESPYRKKLVEFVASRAETAREKIDDESASKSEKTRALRTVITSSQILRFLGEWEKVETEELLIVLDQQMSLYLNTQVLDDGAQGGQREVKAGDDLALLIAHALVDLCNREPEQENSVKGREYLHLACCVLKEAYAHSPTGFQLALQMIEIYGRLDMLDSICKLYNSLDIKHIQIDSLTHLVLGTFLQCGGLPEAAQCCQNVEELWRSTRGDGVEYSRRAFQLGNLVNGSEFMRLDKLLYFSHQRVVALAENYTLDTIRYKLESWELARQSLLASARPHDEIEPHQTSRLGDVKHLNILSSNYDFTVRASSDSPLGGTARFEHHQLKKNKFPCVTQARSCTSHANYDSLWHSRSLAWLQFRIVITEVFAAALEPSACTNPESKAVLKSKFSDSVEKIGIASDDKIFPVGINAFDCTFSLLGEAFSAVEETKGFKESAATLCSSLESLSTYFASKTNLLRETSRALSQSLFWATILVRAWMDMCPKKKKKKKNPGPEEAALEEIQSAIKAVSVSLIQCLDSLEAILGTEKVHLRSEEFKLSHFENLKAHTPQWDSIERFALHDLSNEECDLQAETLGKLEGVVTEFRSIVKALKY